MKTHLDINHEGTLGDDRVRMEFDADSAAHLMSILTDLYSDPAKAVIREYSTNARDSHVAAGRPIEVELPSALRSLFVVRDFGTGLTIDQITQNFSKYGWSSKRGTDAEGVRGQAAAPSDEARHRRRAGEGRQGTQEDLVAQKGPRRGL